MREYSGNIPGMLCNNGFSSPFICRPLQNIDTRFAYNKVIFYCFKFIKGATTAESCKTWHYLGSLIKTRCSGTKGTSINTSTNHAIAQLLP